LLVVLTFLFLAVQPLSLSCRIKRSTRLVVALLASVPQFLSHTRTAIGAPLGFMNGVQLLDQLLISQFPNAGLALAPPVIAAASRLQHLAPGLNGIIVSKLFDHAISLLYCSEKMAIVFFKMSRCIVTRSNSLRNCWFCPANSSGLCGGGGSEFACLARGP